MPALVVDGMQYGRLEVPVFLAQFYRLVSDETTGEVTAVVTNPAAVKEIRFSHYVQHSAFSETAFDPVEGLQNIAVPLETLHEVPVESPDTFAGTPTSAFPYHFIFIPDELGNMFYPRIGAYKTVFEFLGENGETIETVAYRSECGTMHGDGRHSYGDTVRILGSVWTKRLDVDAGVVMFDDPVSNVAEIYRTIYSGGLPVAGQDRVPIGSQRLKPDPVDSPAAFMNSGVEKFLYNFEHTFETQTLPGPGDYLVRLELEHDTGVSLGVAETNLKLT